VPVKLTLSTNHVIGLLICLRLLLPMIKECDDEYLLQNPTKKLTTLRNNAYKITTETLLKVKTIKYFNLVVHVNQHRCFRFMKSLCFMFVQTTPALLHALWKLYMLYCKIYPGDWNRFSWTKMAESKSLAFSTRINRQMFRHCVPEYKVCIDSLMALF